MRTGMRLVLWAVSSLFALAGCSASGSDGTVAPAKDCVPEAARACTCSDGRDGSQVCSASGFWKSCTCGTCSVTPTCTGKACGADDGCGNTCLVGACPSGQKCKAGACSSDVCVPECTGKACGDPDLCGGICTSGTCSKPGFACVAGKCECKPVCVTCGADDTCGNKCTTGACDVGFKCSATGCAVDPASKWAITVTKGSLPSDGGWNTFSAPDPMVCLWLGGSRRCTADVSDTLSPTWGCTFPAVSAATLMTGVDVEMFDNDRSGAGTCAEVLSSPPGEAICSRGTVPLTASAFKTRTWGASCSGMSFSATLAPVL